MYLKINGEKCGSTSPVDTNNLGKNSKVMDAHDVIWKRNSAFDSTISQVKGFNP